MREPEQKRDKKRKRETGTEPEREGATQGRRGEGGGFRGEEDRSTM